MMMRLVSFFALSLAVHAGALVYPISFGGKPAMELLHVTMLSTEVEAPAEMGNGSDATPTAKPGIKPLLRRQSTVSPKAESTPNSGVVPQALAVEPPSAVIDNALPLALTSPNSEASPAAVLSSFGGNGAAAAGTSSGGHGRAGEGSGSSGAGSEAGNGQDRSQNGNVLTQARYRETPRPNYPDSARREGREGKVLLRVLVDDQGRSKQVEINTSSGSAVLDRAAAEAIKRWRFHPARYGDQPVESWLRIPVEFRLADRKSW